MLILKIFLSLINYLLPQYCSILCLSYPVQPVGPQEAEVDALGVQPGVNYFIGINDIEVEGQFVYASNGEDITWSQWNSDEPNNAGDEDCVEMRDHAWNDIPCGYPQYYICEIN